MEKFVDTPELTDVQAARQNWMGILASSPAGRVKALWSDFQAASGIEFQVIRKPERGLVMVRGRAGSAGDKFNLGEMTVTRCAVRMPTGETGVSYISGRDLEHALFAAQADAMLQTDAYADDVMSQIITPLSNESDVAADQRAAKVAGTRVNFFTMVRTREDKK